jgi:hypothetical protein
MKARWWFSLVLLAVYLATFQLWLVLPRPGIIATGAVATIGLGALFLRAAKVEDFLNYWDALWHGSVILDLALEGIFVPRHLDHSFYFCAVAFLLVIGGYRTWLLRRRNRQMSL